MEVDVVALVRIDLRAEAHPVADQRRGGSPRRCTGHGECEEPHNESQRQERRRPGLRITCHTLILHLVLDARNTGNHDSFVLGVRREYACCPACAGASGCGCGSAPRTGGRHARATSRWGAGRMSARTGEQVSAPLGRDDEHERVLGVLDGLREGPRALLLTGEAGVGKTTVLEAALGEARRRGYRVLSCEPGVAEVQFSFAGLGDLLDIELADILPELPPPQVRALTAALGLVESESAFEPRLLGLALLN